TSSLVPMIAHADRNQNREVRQQARIRQGVKSGELTRPEAKRLRQGQRHVDRMQNRAEADGVVTDAEKMRLENAQDRQSTRIYNQKHDEQQRPKAEGQ
ncbi:hypothetical protein K2X05_07785, partial [bacterium]|nr:hypothetical protein [bacterium]